MRTEERHTGEQQSEHSRRTRGSWTALLDRLSRKAIVNNVPYLAFVALLCIVYMGMNKSAVETQRMLNRMNDTIKGLRWEHAYMEHELLSVQNERQITEAAQVVGLKPMTMQPFIVRKDSLNNREAEN